MTSFFLQTYENTFLPCPISDAWHAAKSEDLMDGTVVADWLRSIGETVISNRDTGRNGEASTASGYTVSTNGYVFSTHNDELSEIMSNADDLAKDWHYNR
jgi:hypothetical protein